MINWSGLPLGLALALLVAAAPAGLAADIQPHRALYSLTLDSAKSGSGVIGATGAMYYEWGETCDGWTIEQRFRLRLAYAEADNSDLSSTLVTWEAKDGLRYRFNERRLKDGEPDEDIHGEAHLDGPGKGGAAEFGRPESATITLAPGVIFPTAHTLLLIERARAGDQFISRQVFDGSTVDNASQITAVIGSQIKAGDEPNGKVGPSPVLQRPSWRIRLAFFPPNGSAELPDYELGIRLYDNGATTDMLLDYGDYVIRATLDEIEALPKPAC
ncbi:MAG TPA: cell envelope integrity EipB family protein [Stellaceae bacterium]|nr:cell envelope integrity EipB family protein [Stellaceae bacterium]